MQTNPKHRFAAGVLRLCGPSSGLLAAVLLALFIGSAAMAEAGAVININTATPEELQALPGVGEARAAAIVEAREERGGFDALEDLLEVKGIGPAGLERLRPHAKLSGTHRLPQGEGNAAGR